MATARILVVCTANICRSPLAERLLAEYFRRRAPELDVEVSSAGTRARPGDPAADGMLRIADKWGLDLSRHRSRRVDAELVREQALVLTMEDEHRSVVSRLTRGVGQRTFTITELAELIAATTEGPAGTGGDAVAEQSAAESWRLDDTAPMQPVRPAQASTAVSPTTNLLEQVAAWHAARTRRPLAAPDVADPSGLSREDYARCAARLGELVEQIGPALVVAARPEA